MKYSLEWRWCENNNYGGKITVMQQRPTVDLRRRLTNFKMLVVNVSSYCYYLIQFLV